MLKFLIISSYIAGIICAGVAILRSRTPQGATAWVMALLSFPFISVPFYILFGRIKFEGYHNKRKILNERVEKKIESLKSIKSDYFLNSEEVDTLSRLVASDNHTGFTCKNRIKLLVNSSEAYPEMLQEIQRAKNYIVFQFYVIRTDETGNMFLNALMKKSREGVRVTLMYDALGSTMSKASLKELREAGIYIGTFNEGTHKGKFQVNFRNHRKILVIDGEVAFLGGLNIGDEYQGVIEKYGPWRDTHVRIEGPSVIAAQLASAKDWYCIHESPMQVDWTVRPSMENSSVMVLHSGPADEKNTCLLSYLSLINSATKKLWVANPYFVPPETLLDALLLASMRGVDVRLLIPGFSDAKLVNLASKIYQKKILKHGIRVFRYNQGFLHQKVMVVDDRFAIVGSANFDYRSMFINFEAIVISTDQTFVSNCSSMLEKDFQVSEEVILAEFENMTLLKRISIRGANLLAPIL